MRKIINANLDLLKNLSPWLRLELTDHLHRTVITRHMYALRTQLRPPHFTRTVTSDCLYTPLYASPEVARAVLDDTAVQLSRCMDMWSFGITVLPGERNPPLKIQPLQNTAVDFELCG